MPEKRLTRFRYLIRKVAAQLPHAASSLTFPVLGNSMATFTSFEAQASYRRNTCCTDQMILSSCTPLKSRQSIGRRLCSRSDTSSWSGRPSVPTSSAQLEAGSVPECRENSLSERPRNRGEDSAQYRLQDGLGSRLAQCLNRVVSVSGGVAGCDGWGWAC